MLILYSISFRLENTNLYRNRWEYLNWYCSCFYIGGSNLLLCKGFAGRLFCLSTTLSYLQCEVWKGILISNTDPSLIMYSSDRNFLRSITYSDEGSSLKWFTTWECHWCILEMSGFCSILLRLSYGRLLKSSLSFSTPSFVIVDRDF